MDDLITKLNLDSPAKDIAEKLRDNIKHSPTVWTGVSGSQSGIQDFAPYENQYLVSLMNYKGAQLNEKATNKLFYATLGLIFATIGLIIATLW